MIKLDGFLAGVLFTIIILIGFSITVSGRNNINDYLKSDLYKEVHCAYVDNFSKDLTLRNKISKEFFCRF